MSEAMRLAYESDSIWQETIFGRIPSEWNYEPLENFFSLITYGFTNPMPTTENGHYMLTAKDIFNGKIQYTTARKTSQDAYAKLLTDKSRPKINDILITKDGSIGRVAITDKENICISQSVALIRPNQRILPLFLKYLLESPQYQQLINIDATGSTIQHIYITKINKMLIGVPHLPEQKAIAAVLSSLDDKIDLLHRQNHTLEAMAETLFRQWFVEEAQEDWEKGALGDVITVKGGTTPSTKETQYWDGNIHWTSPRDLSNHNSVFLFDTERKITEKGLTQISSGLLPIGTVLLSSRAPIGYLAIADIPVAINQGYIAIICDKVVSNYFMYLWCKTNMEEIKSAGNGSTFEEISKSNFKELGLAIPPKEILMEFDAKVSLIFGKIKINKKQIQTLEKLRDTLLPKLMSGEVRVA